VKEKDGDSPLLTLDDMPFKLLIELLRFIYTDQVTLRSVLICPLAN